TTTSGEDELEAMRIGKSTKHRPATQPVVPRLAIIDSRNVRLGCAMKILVTGGTGVIGNGAIPALLRAGHQVRLLTRHASRDVRGFPEGVEAFEADLANPEELTSGAEGCDVVVHIAGIVDESPPEVTFQNVNVDGTRHMLE